MYHNAPSGGHISRTLSGICADRLCALCAFFVISVLNRFLKKWARARHALQPLRSLHSKTSRHLKKSLHFPQLIFTSITILVILFARKSKRREGSNPQRVEGGRQNAEADRKIRSGSKRYRRERLHFDRH